jgi:hypothetical protein
MLGKKFVSDPFVLMQLDDQSYICAGEDGLTASQWYNPFSYSLMAMSTSDGQSFPVFSQRHSLVVQDRTTRE